MPYIRLEPVVRTSYVPPKECPFCKNTTGPTKYEAPYSLPNKYPFVDTDSPSVNYGYNQMIVFSENHEEQLCDLPTPNMTKLLYLIGKLEEKFLADPKISHVLTFQVFGTQLGGTISHGHMQTIAVTSTSDAWYPYSRLNSGCQICENTFVVFENLGARVIVPEASRVPHEVHIVPKQHINHLSIMETGDLESLANALSVSISIINHFYGGAHPYHLYIQRPREPINETHHFSIEILPYVLKPGALGPIETTLGLYPNYYSQIQALIDLRQQKHEQYK